MLKFISIFFYIASLFFPVFLETKYYGFQLLFLGWMSLSDPLHFFAWLSNIFYIKSLMKSTKVNQKVIYSIITLLLGSLSFFIKEIISNGAGNREEVTLCIGFYLWFSSYIFALIYNFMNLREKI